MTVDSNDPARLVQLSLPFHTFDASETFLFDGSLVLLNCAFSIDLFLGEHPACVMIRLERANRGPSQHDQTST